jgi:hypothetical protein
VSLAAYIRSIPARTQDSGSARISLDISIGTQSTSGATNAITEHGSGAFAFAHKQGQLSISIPPLGNAQIEILVTGNAVYEKLPAQFGAALSHGKPWVKFDLSALGAFSSANPYLGTSSNPTQSLDYLLGVSNDVRVVGTDTIRGTQTTHYKLVLDLKKAAERLPAVSRRLFERVVSVFGTSGVPADVWADSHGRLRKFDLQLSITPKAGPAAGKNIRVSESLELYDFGVKVSVSPPPASQVTDITSTVQALAGAAGSGSSSG